MVGQSEDGFVIEVGREVLIWIILGSGRICGVWHAVALLPLVKVVKTKVKGFERPNRTEMDSSGPKYSDMVLGVFTRVAGG